MIYIDNQETIVSDSVGTTEATENTQPVEQTESQIQPTETGTQEGDESFFDPQSVPEELKPVYKGMQSAYTKKTQELANQRKELETYREKANAYDKYSQHIPIVEEMLKSKNQSMETPELKALEQKYKDAGYSDEAIDMMKMGIGFALNHINQSQAQIRQQDWVNARIQEAASVDPRLTDAALVYDTGDGQKATFGQIVEELVMADSKWQTDPVAATKRAIKKVDALIGKAKTEGKEELSTAAKAKAAKFPSNQSSPQSTADTEPKGSMRDIGKQVAAELGIKI